MDRTAFVIPNFLANAAMRARIPRIFVVFLASWMVVVTGLVLAVSWKNHPQRAVLLMAWGLILLWIAGCGLAMFHWRDFWCRLSNKVRLPWGVKFVLGCTFLACLEESITTLMTNCAPLFGVKIGQAYITASANYFDVILYHSVVVFVPFFVGWAVMLRYWKFSPFAVFVLFGITGLFCETISFGLQNLGSFGFWMLVYGLMIWLPAHWAPVDRPAREPRWWAYPLAVFIPYLFMPLMPVLAPWILFTAKHPSIHFPPIGGG